MERRRTQRVRNPRRPYRSPCGRWCIISTATERRCILKTWFAYWSPDGSRLIYITDNFVSKQPPEVVIVEMPGGEQTCRFRGHKDVITSASWPPDGTITATASWDHTFGLWVAVSWIRRHTIRTNGQDWTGDGSSSAVAAVHADSVSSMSRRQHLIVALQRAEDTRLESCLRNFTGYPFREQISLPNGFSLLVWHPFESIDKPGHPVLQTTLALRPDSGLMINGLGALGNLQWIDHQRPGRQSC